MHPQRPPAEKDEKSARVDLRALLDRLENDLAELKVRFEQYFSGLLPLPPDKPHNEVKKLIRTLRKAPFKSSTLVYRLKTLENRYNTFNTYWQRVLRAREDGTYARDVFKADIRQRFQKEDDHAKTEKGMSEKSMQNLFNSYKTALEQTTGKQQDLDYPAFQKSLVQRVHDLKDQFGAKKFTFKIVVQDGKVSLKAKVKEEKAD